MNKTDREEMIEKLKKQYKNNETVTKENGRNYIQFNLGEIDVPKEVKGEYLRVIPNEGKNYLMFTLYEGMSEEVKQERKDTRRRQKKEIEQKREEIKERYSNLRKDLKQQVKQAKNSLKSAIRNTDGDLATRLIDKISELEKKILNLKVKKSSELDATRVRKRRD